MAGAAKRWAIGCGIGCGLMIIIAGGIGTCAYMGVKKIADGAEGMDEGFEILDETYGQPGEFVPEPDGTIPFDRLELFAAVRDDLAPAREKLAGLLLVLDEEGRGNVIEKFKAGIKLIPSIFEFINTRNQVLVERGMGLGEYTHIYTVAYFAWLEKDVSDGPSFKINDNDSDDGDVRWSVSSPDDKDVHQTREEDMRRYLHDLQREMLANQLAAAEGGALDEAWLAELQAEAARMDDRSRRLLWENELPAQLRASLEPFRVRLDESYSAIMNAVEMGTMTHH